MVELSPWMHTLLDWLALPHVGLSSVFVISFVSATLLPLGSEPAVYGLVTLRPELFWPAIFVATTGNTLGGMLDYWLGYGAKQALAPKSHGHALAWLEKYGAKSCLLSWLPIVGDPLCAVAGWLKLPFWPCVLYMAIGKFLRYLIMTAVLIWAI